MNPDDMGGVPQTIPTNSWWDLGMKALDDVSNVAIARIAGQRAAASGGIASNGVNPPPGSTGVNAQAATVPGGAIQFTRAGAMLSGSWMYILVGLAAALALVLVLKKRG